MPGRRYQTQGSLTTESWLQKGIDTPRTCSLSSDPLKWWWLNSLANVALKTMTLKLKMIGFLLQIKSNILGWHSRPSQMYLCAQFTDHISLHPTMISLGTCLLFCMECSSLGPSPPVKVVSSLQVMSPLSTWSPPQGAWNPSQGLYSLWGHMALLCHFVFFFCHP